jgi:hypothetical protein
VSPLKIVGWGVLALIALALMLDPEAKVTAEADTTAAPVETFAFTEEGPSVETEIPPADAVEEGRAVTWEWVENPACDYGRCWQIRVTAPDGCPNGVYAEMNITDDAGVVVDYSNDALGSLAPGQTGVLTFTHFDDAPRQGEITQVSCN